MSGYLSLMTRELNIITATSITSLTSLITKYPTIGARKAKQKKDLNYHAWTSSSIGGHQLRGSSLLS